ncbi:hypothetical protein [Paenibacillus xylanexedens]|uniref:hypothetical protein n=1 Tax=Paenibacillus xylanexedens TaxID=528191 RepID=UPI0011AA9BFA|nr:hypothetical protein [Paenibacillus xylanexedens]
MKTPILLHDFSSIENIAGQFEIPLSVVEAYEVLLASYTYENYEGDAFLLLRQNGTLYEVNGSHCSCYGLEGQWSTEDTTIAALQHRLDAGYMGRYYWDKSNLYADELQELLNALRKEGQE